MAYGRRWKPSKAKVEEFKKQMNEIDSFCDENGIIQSASYKAYEDLIEVIDFFDYLFTMYDARIMYLLDEQLPKLCEQLPMEGE